MFGNRNYNRPLIGASLGLLAGGLGGRVNPLQAAMMGMQMGQSMEDRRDDRKRREAYQQAVQSLGGPPPGVQTAGPGGFAPGAAQQLNMPPGMGDLLAAMGPEQGMPLLGRILMDQNKPSQRQIMKDAEGFNRYVDTGERVFPGAQAKAPSMTALQKNLMAQGLQPGTPEFQEAIRTQMAKPQGTTVNVGPQGVQYPDAPKGMVWARNEDGTVALQQDPNTGFSSPIAVPIAGGPVEQERQQAEEAQQLAQETRERQSNLIMDEIGRARDIVQKSPRTTTGMLGGFLSNIRETDAGALAGMIQTIRANIGFDRLQQMRDASPTGGALGQVSERELTYLQSTLGDLEQSQDDQQFLYNLDRVENAINDVVHGSGNAPNAFGGMSLEQLQALDTTQMSDAELEAAGRRYKELGGQ